jgi:uncharacterized heparinase superfamily protein
MVSKLKRPPTEWEKIFATYTFDQGLITRIFRKLKKLSPPKINDPVKKWAKELNIFQRKKFKWLKNMKKCSTSLAIKEIHIKTC